MLFRSALMREPGRLPSWQHLDPAHGLADVVGLATRPTLASLAGRYLFYRRFAHHRGASAAPSRSGRALPRLPDQGGRHQRDRHRRDLGANPMLGDVWHTSLGREHGLLGPERSADERALLHGRRGYRHLEAAAERMQQAGRWARAPRRTTARWGTIRATLTG